MVLMLHVRLVDLAVQDSLLTVNLLKRANYAGIITAVQKKRGLTFVLADGD